MRKEIGDLKIKSCFKNSEGFITLWQQFPAFDYQLTDTLRVENESVVLSQSFKEHDLTFAKMKKEHTIINMSVQNEVQMDEESGEKI